MKTRKPKKTAKAAPKQESAQPKQVNCRAKQIGHHACTCAACEEGRRAP